MSMFFVSCCNLNLGVAWVVALGYKTLLLAERKIQERKCIYHRYKTTDPHRQNSWYMDHLVVLRHLVLGYKFHLVPPQDFNLLLSDIVYYFLTIYENINTTKNIKLLLKNYLIHWTRTNSKQTKRTAGASSNTKLTRFTR